MTNYLQYIPKPLLDDLLHARWLPVIGAGMSRNAVVPAGDSIPLWKDLGDLFGREMQSYDPTGPVDAMSAYEQEFGRPKLVEKLIELLLIDRAQPGETHAAFCSIPFDIVCTTNFDFLLERQYDSSPRYCRPVIDEDQLSINVQESSVLLLKLHGDLHHPNRLIVSEADYDGFLSTFPLLATYLANLLITRTPVFVGYSLEDPDFRQIWRVVTDRLGRSRRQAYAFAVGENPTNVARFERRGVKVINFPGARSRQGEVLAQVFRQLREFFRDHVISVSRVIEELPLRELTLPRNSTTRLCFVAVPAESLPFYREHVFPLVHAAGLVPISSDEVVSPGDNAFAKVDALIDRAAVVLVEATSQWTWAELRMALARTSEGSREDDQAERPLFTRNQILAVITDQDELPPNLEGVRVLTRPDLISEDPGYFLSELENILTGISDEMEIRISEEPLRLFEAREYRAAVIAAMSLLEMTLRERRSEMDVGHRETFALRGLLVLAETNGLAPQGFAARALPWLTVRNAAVHSRVSVSRAEANDIVHGVMEIVRALQIRRK